MATARKPASARLAAIFAACAAAAALLVASEGWVLKVAPDPVGIQTGCAGVTQGMKAGQVLGEDECVARTAQAMVDHAVAIDRCIQVEIPVKTRAAFVDFAYNVGAPAFCGSTLARKLNAGDVPGACAELSRWVYAGGKPLPGLVKRRAAERALCEAGLAAGG